MGCFLGCFGSKKDRKRRKQRYKVIPRGQNQRGQNLVQGDVSLVQRINDNPSDSLPELRVKNDEPLSFSTRKKVTFDTDVTTYEHVQVYDSSESLLEKNEKSETFPKSGETHSHSGYEEDINIVSVKSYRPNYHYGNCLENDDEVEDYSNSEDQDNDYLNDEEDYDDVEGIIPSMELRNESSLLKPVENLSQWKALKSKSLNSDPQKENSPFPSKNRIQETAVDTSLSDWLVSSEKNTPNNKPISSGNSVKSIEDRPILGVLTSDELKQFSGTPRKSPGRSPDDDRPIIGSVGSYWSHSDNSAKSLNSTSSYKGIPNTTSKYREDKKVNWHNTPFQTRLERALNRDAATEA